ncbi:MAG: hypothetical protein GAK40_00759 [Burkholderia plantarii]|nr:MAG: hypothetical protein GAK40_00759 [Burkholderia plantarii]
MLALKLTLVPLFLFVVSKSGTWWGPSVAGWLAGLPVVAGPILFLLVLVLAHGAAFGAHAALMSLAAIFASEAFNFAYAWTSRTRRWPIALAVALAAWFVAALALSRLPASPLAAVAFGQSFLPRAAAGAGGLPLTRADLVGRMIAGAALTLAVTALSGYAGASWSGLLAVFPLLGSVLAVGSHRAHGSAFVIALLRGMVLGRFSFAAFCLLLAVLLPRVPVGAAFAAASAAALLVQAATRRLAHAVQAMPGRRAAG